MKIIVPTEAEILGMTVSESFVSTLDETVSLYLVDVDLAEPSYFTFENKLVVFYRQEIDEWSVYSENLNREILITPHFYGPVFLQDRINKGGFTRKYNQFFGIYLPTNDEYLETFLPMVKEIAPEFDIKDISLRFGFITCVILPEEDALINGVGIAKMDNALKMVVTKDGLREFDEILMAKSLKESKRQYLEYWDSRSGEYI